jgi:hypothetical protein
MKPTPNDSIAINGNNYQWTMKESNQGIFLFTTSVNNFVSYGALYLYTSKPENVCLAYRHDNDFMVRVNGQIVCLDSGWISINSPDHLVPLPLTQGLNLLLFKLNGNSAPNWFSVRFTDNSGVDRNDLFVQYTPDPLSLPPVSINQHYRCSPKRTSALEDVLVNSNNLRITIQQPGKSIAFLMNLAGQTIAAWNINGAGCHTLRIPNTSTGIYIVKIQDSKMRPIVKRIFLNSRR